MQGATTRWWENYLVRYLMPSIAGAVAVSWLSDVAGNGFRQLLRLPAATEALPTPGLVLLFLYGNLFCYVASYPILVFHATRSLDFNGRETRWRWRQSWRDGYLTTAALAVLAFAASVLLPVTWACPAAFGIVGLFAAVQLLRLYSALHPRRAVEGLNSHVSPAFGFAYALARRRGLRFEEKDTSVAPNAASSSQSPQQQSAPGTQSGLQRRVDPDDDEADENRVMRNRSLVDWRSELVDTYRHMREHGNSAFIFVLELTLAALVFCLLSAPEPSVDQKLSSVGILLGLWAAPSVLVHFAGQHMERRFSRFDER